MTTTHDPVREALAEEAKLWISQVVIAAHRKSPAQTKVAVEALEAFIDRLAASPAVAAVRRIVREEIERSQKPPEQKFREAMRAQAALRARELEQEDRDWNDFEKSLNPTKD